MATRSKIVAIAGAVALLLTACGGYKAEHGTIIELTFSPEESGWHYVPTTQCNYNPSTKSSQCRTNMVYTYYFYPECYKVRVEDEAEHRGSYCISGVEWQDLEIGEFYDHDTQS